jgi:putative DNA primase/helicase
VLKEPFAEFPFLSEGDRAVALSAIPSALLGGVIKSPVHAFSGPSKGTGKSLLCDLVALIVLGTPCPVIAQGTAREELEKRLTAAALQGSPLLSIDNCTQPLQGDFLCQLMTQEIASLRPLGSSRLVATPLATFVMATGNNLRIGNDMTRRTLYSALDAKCERPELRRFKRKDVREYVRNHRGQLVVAALTILRAYQVAGMPLKGKLKPLGSFERWCDLVRDALVWAGATDPCETIERARETDPELEALIVLMAAWEMVIGPRKTTVKELISTATGSGKNADVLRDALLEVAGDGSAISSRKLGSYLAAVKDRIVRGRCVEKTKYRGNVSGWRLVQRASED